VVLFVVVGEHERENPSSVSLALKTDNTNDKEEAFETKFKDDVS
jgi:hypothetical protein